MGLKTFKYMEFTFDDGRYERSKEIVCLPIDEEGHALPEKHYMAFGSDAATVHYLKTVDGFDCDCHDFAWGNDRLCKHILAALEHEGDELLAAILSGDPVTKCKVTIVCGPPKSGKTTFVQCSAEFGDFVWDMDAVASATVWGKTHATHGTQRILRAMRDAALHELDKAVKGGSGLTGAWIIWSLPKAGNRERLAKRFNAEIVVLEATPDLCVDRSDPDEATQVGRAAQKWWEDYSRRADDHVIVYDE